MKHTSEAENILGQINTKTKLGDLRKIAKAIKKDHELALELWSTGKFLTRLLSLLIMDNKHINLESCEDSISTLQRRIFWYYQARLRWTGQTPPANTPELLAKIETNMAKEEPEVQWAMNFTAGWIGVYEKQYRNRCIAIGEKTGLYRGDMVSKGCTPNYLPEFIAIESNKRDLF